MTVELDQALFGYDRGHRLVASSRRLGKEATWVLRNVTDMKVPKRNGHYLTVLPVAELEVHAFVRTWAAGGDFRPGSVWSHALLVPSGELDRIEDLRVLEGMFRRPKIDGPDAIGTLKATYGEKVTAPEALGVDFAADEPVDSFLLDRLVLAAYTADVLKPAEVVVDDARQVEGVVLGLMSQRWSHLRRRFSARTRYRPSQTSAAQFALEIVERGSGASERPADLIPKWVAALSADLREPNKRLRLFLHVHTRGRDDEPIDIARITDVLVSAAVSPSAGVEAVAHWFPRPADRIALKQDLFGPRPSATTISDTWPTTDPGRLNLLLSVPASAVSLADYRVGARLADWARASPVDAAVALLNANVAARPEADINELVLGISTGFDAEWVGKVIVALPALAPTVLVDRPDLWSSPEVWTTEVDHQMLVDLIGQAEPDRRCATYLGLLANGLASSAGELLATNPSLWWAIVDPEQADRVAGDHPVLSGSRRLAPSVATTRGPSPWPLTTLAQATIIASVSDPDEGLWRSIDADLWVEAYKTGVQPVTDDANGSLRRDVMALAAGAASNDPDQRRLLWSIAFPRLHRALLGAGTPLGCERTLATLLPDGPSWDWCGRLRYGLARTAVTDRWSEAELHDISQGADDFAHDVIQAAEGFRHRQSRWPLGNMVDFFTWWMR